MDSLETLLLGYVGLGPGLEFIPYFLALMGVVGAALLAVLQWPLLALISFFRVKRRRSEATDAQALNAGASEPRENADNRESI